MTLAYNKSNMKRVRMNRLSSDETSSPTFVEDLPFPARTSGETQFFNGDRLTGAIRIELPGGLALHASLQEVISERLDDRGAMVWTEGDQLHVLYGVHASEFDDVLPLAEGLARKLGGTVLLTAVMELPPPRKGRSLLVGL